MNPQSALQQQFPLSPKKFWKKMFSGMPFWYILGIAGIVILAIIWIMSGDTINTLGKEILGGLMILDVVLVAIISISYGIYVKAYIKRYFYAGEENFVTIKKGVFTPAEIHVQYMKIQDVYVDQDLLDRMMGLYDVHIASATAQSGIEAHIDGVDKASADGLKKFFLEKVSGNSNNPTAANPSQTMQQNAAASGANNASAQILFTSTEEISNKKYPLTGTWIGIQIINRLLISFVSWFFIIFLFGIRLFTDTGSNGTTNAINPAAWGYAFLAWIGISILSSLVHMIGLFMWKKNYTFNFTPQNIYYKDGILSISEKHMPYTSIQDVSVQQSFLERIFGLARVRIENAAQVSMPVGRNGRPIGFAGIQLQGLTIGDANKITDILKTSVLGRNTGRHGL